MFGDDYEAFSDSIPADEITSLENAVRERLPSEGLVSFVDLADALNAIPWDVLRVCRRLVRSGFAREGSGKQHNRFGRS